LRYVEESSEFDWSTAKRVEKEAPTYCPLCGRKLEGFVWVVSDEKAYYPSLVCYNGMARWLVGFRKWFSVTRPDGAHYQFEFERQEAKPPVEKFDKITGKPKGE
jgi:hypothetical protein